MRSRVSVRLRPGANRSRWRRDDRDFEQRYRAVIRPHAPAANGGRLGSYQQDRKVVRVVHEVRASSQPGPAARTARSRAPWPAAEHVWDVEVGDV